MVLRFSLVAVAVLTACNAGGPGFRGVPHLKQEVAGSRFLLRTRGAYAEVIRVSPERLPRFETVAQKASVAVFRETGCVPRWIIGDPAVMTMGLSCNGALAPPKPKRRKTLVCDAYDGHYSRGADSYSFGLDCALD